MGSRTELQTLLETLLGSTNVYFQPPLSSEMIYPCIVFNLSNINIEYANNYPYKNKKRYNVTVIDKDPDSLIVDKVSKLQFCVFDRHFTIDNLNHYIFNIYF